MNFFQILRVITSLLPLLHEIIDQVESAFPQGGYGAQKLDLVKNAIEKTMAISDTTGAMFNATWPAISGVVANMVALKKLVKPDPSLTVVNAGAVTTH